MFGIESLSSTTGFAAYALVFIMAAVPWFEILIVIPPAIAMGMDPFVVSFLAFTGNLVTVFLLVFAHHSLNTIWKKFRVNEDNPENTSAPSGRRKKAIKLWNSYGLPGIAMMGPLILGTHFAALIALSLGSKKNPVALWMTISLFIWTIIIAAVSYYGIESLKWIAG
ncbi:MAG: small multi-drug export protein [Methanolobus sp.]|nr:small multi-drug export protein [Methanolobus sp.]